MSSQRPPPALAISNIEMKNFTIYLPFITHLAASLKKRSLKDKRLFFNIATPNLKFFYFVPIISWSVNRKLLAIKNQNWKNDIVNVKVLRGLSEIRKSASSQGSKKSVKLAYVDFLAMFEKKLWYDLVFIFLRDFS